MGVGTYTLMDAQYREMMQLNGGGGALLDLHELLVSAKDTALVVLYRPVQMDLTSRGGAPDTTLVETAIQEIDIASGTVLFEWRPLDHLGFDESVLFPPTEPGKFFDPIHVNSIDIDTDDNLLISARNTCALYKLNRETQEIMWRLSGARTTPLPDPKLELDPASEGFFFQHDARRNKDGTVSIFDDGGSPYNHDGRAVVLRLDEVARTATEVKQFGSEFGIRVNYQGSAQQQPNGNMLVGWGNIGRVTEFTPDGAVCFDATFTGNSYRARRFAWTGTPDEVPAIAAAREDSGARVWASWNGSTEVRQWRVLGGRTVDSLAPLGVQPWDDFETAVRIDQAPSLVAVEALDAGGATLARSMPVAVTSA